MEKLYHVDVTISTDLSRVGRIVLGNFLAKAFARLDNPRDLDLDKDSISGLVHYEDYLALYALGEKGLLTVDFEGYGQ